MLQKYLAVENRSVPIGLYHVNEDMKKGTAVYLKFVAATDNEPAKFVLTKPTTADEAKDFFGFVTLAIEFKEHKESYYDMLDTLEPVVCYTRAHNVAFKTTEFVGELTVGDKCVIGYESADAGKVRKAKDGEAVTMEVMEVFAAMAGYEEAMVAVRML